MLVSNYNRTAQPVPSNQGFGLPDIGPGGFLNILGTGVKAFGEWQQGQDIAGAYEFNSALEMDGLNFDIGRIDVAEKELAGTQAAVYAKAGVTMSGSPMDVMLKSATNFEMDKQVAQYNVKSKIAMNEYQASKAKEQANFNVASTLLSGALALAPLIL